MEEELQEQELITFKCKPTYAFQSIEFEYTCDANNPDDFVKMEIVYNKAIELMMRCAPEQPDAKKPVKKGPRASDRQKAYLKKLGIPYPSDITAKEASELITQATEDDDDELF